MHQVLYATSVCHIDVQVAHKSTCAKRLLLIRSESSYRAVHRLASEIMLFADVMNIFPHLQENKYQLGSSYLNVLSATSLDLPDQLSQQSHRVHRVSKWLKAQLWVVRKQALMWLLRAPHQIL